MVRTEPARKGKVAEIVEGLGRCESLPDHMATLTPAVQGHVHSILARQGDMVRKGQPIIELDRTVAEADLAEKTGSHSSLKAALVLLKSLPRAAERRANELAVDQAKNAVERSKAVLERLRPLAARREVSEQQLFDAEKAFQAAQLQQQAAEATLIAMMIGPRPEAIAEAEARIKMADGLRQFSQAHLEFHTIRAPIDGVLDSLTCHPGQAIAVGTPVGSIVDTRLVYATVWLPARSAHSLRTGDTARVVPADFQPGKNDAMAGEATILKGKVDSIGQIADPQTGNLPARVLTENPRGLLAMGQTVHVMISLKNEQNLVQVPVAAILDLGEGPILPVVRDGKAVLLHPALGTESDGWVAISHVDLKQGEPVITDGGYNLPEGTPVKVAPNEAVVREEARP